MAETLYIIDGHSQIYRAYYAPFRDLTSPTGEPTRATYVFMSMLLKFIEQKRPRYLAVAIDGPAKDLKRRELYPDYKVTRKPTPEDFHPQEKRILELLRTLGVPVLEKTGYEADDIIATLVDQYAASDMDTVIISRDKDLYQLLDDHCRLYDPMKDETIDAATVEKTKGYRPDQAVDIQSLMGDSIDNVPGVPGVGEKTAVKLIARYGSARAVLDHADEQTPKLKERLTDHADQVELSRQLVQLDRHVPLEATLDDLTFDNPDFAALQPMFEQLGFGRLMDKLRSVADEPLPDKADPPDTSPPGPTTSAGKCDYRLIDTAEGLAELAETLKTVNRLAVDTETTDVRPMWASLVGISLSWQPAQGVYLPLAGPLGATTLDLNDVKNAIGPVLADPAVTKVGHHLKYDLIILRRAGIELAGPYFCTLLAAHVLDSTRMTYKLDALAMELLNHHCVPISQLIGTGKKAITMDRVPTDVVATYAAEDADIALRLADALNDQLDRQGLGDLLANLELPLMPVLADMEQRGVQVDPQTLKSMQTELTGQADTLRERIVALAGCEFNVDSPKQLASILFEKLAYPTIKKTKTGASTDSGVLEQLAADHDAEIAAFVLDYRKLTKLIGTYLKSLAECIHPTTGRVHTSFHQAGTATGRLSSSDPNLQNIPIRSREGRLIRSAFVAREGTVMLTADYSQVELRMLAHFCGDETLRTAFERDEDIHRIVAAEVFAKAPEEVTAEERTRAKTVNFGIIYGQTAFGLSRTLRIPRRQADEFITRYRNRFPRIDDFLAQCIEQAKTNGYVETIFKRRRQIPEIDARNPQRRAAAERLAINSVVQGSAADLIKQAMIDLDQRIRREDRSTRMLLQIHDELVFEIDESAVEEDRAMVVDVMTGAIELTVPLKVDVGVGDNWLDAK